MKSGFIFTIIFTLLFTLFLFLSIIYLRNVQRNELDLVLIRNFSKISYVQDDIGKDILDYLRTSIYINKNSTHTSINVTDMLPSTYNNPQSELDTYKSFINGTYANKTNLINPNTNTSLISINTSRFENTPSIHFLSSNSSLNIHYSYNNLSKNELIINETNSIRNYSITIYLNETCLNNNCANATWAGGPPSNDTSTKGLWHLDEFNGTTTADSSGNGNTGNLGGTNWTGGRFVSALSFDGVDDYVSVPYNPSLNPTSAITIEAWIKVNSLKYEGIVGMWTNYATDPSWLLAIYPSVLTMFINGTGGQDNLGEGVSFPLNTWQHIAGVYNGTHIILYRNGIQVAVKSTSISGLATSTQDVEFGRYNQYPNQFNGTIDEVAIYSRAKSAEEIYADANQFHWDWGPIAINNNISAAWHFDEGSGNVTYDSSGNGNFGMFNATQTFGDPQNITLFPTSTNKAFKISSASSDEPFLATTEMSYSLINRSDYSYETSSAIYLTNFTRSCSGTGSVLCEGISVICPGYSCIAVDNCAKSICPSTTGLNATVSSNNCLTSTAYCQCSSGPCPE